MSDEVDRDVDFILSSAPRLAKLSALLTVSFGLSQGANRALRSDAADGKARERNDDWQQAVLGYKDGTQMMAVIRLALLLDSDPKCVSFQTVYRRLLSEEVQTALITRIYGSEQSLAEILGEGSPKAKIDDFLSHYRSIDWAVHGRLTHFRNLGVAHLSEQPLSKTVTITELEALTELVSKLADELVAICQTTFAPISPMIDDWHERGFSVLKFRGD